MSLLFTWRDGRPMTWFGGMTRTVVEECYGGGCPDAVSDLYGMWTLTVADEEPGRNELWADLVAVLGRAP